MRRASAAGPKNVPTVRTRLSVARRDNAEKEEAGYDFYPDRRHLSEEFDKLWAAQAVHSPDVLTDELRDEISVIIFHQRPLKTPEVGLCLFTEEKRIPSAHPLNHRRILFETVNALRVAARGEPARGLTREERDAIVHALDNKGHTKTLAGMAMKLKALGKARWSARRRWGVADVLGCDAGERQAPRPARAGPCLRRGAVRV
ncbi:hypothetical protein OAN15_01330 [bacterium]|nr:hypothetical protein [bacterium]